MTTNKGGRAASDPKQVGAQSSTSGQPSDRVGGTGRDEFTAWLTSSCERQALSVTITDPTALAAIATLLR